MQSRCPFLSHICADDDDDDASLFSHLPKCKYTVSFNIANIQFSRVSILPMFNFQEFQNWQYSIFKSFKIGNIQYSLVSILTIFNIQEFQYCDIQEFVRVLIKPKLELLARQRGGHFDADVFTYYRIFLKTKYSSRRLYLFCPDQVMDKWVLFSNKISWHEIKFWLQAQFLVSGANSGSGLHPTRSDWDGSDRLSVDQWTDLDKS